MTLHYRARGAGVYKLQTPLQWLTRKPHPPAVPERPELVLPTDVVELVIKWVQISYETNYEVNSTLARACRVNRAWCETVRPHLFKRVVLATRVRCDAFLPAIRQLPHLASHVRILSVVLYPSKWEDSYTLTLCDLPWILVGLPMLYELRLELKRTTNTQWRTLWYALRSLPGPAISALRISGNGALFNTDYYQLLNIWPSVQFLCLRGRVRPKLEGKPGMGAKGRCSLRLREFRWECDGEFNLEFLDWLLSPSVGVLEVIHLVGISLSSSVAVATLIHTHAPYLRSLRVPSWDNAITKCHSLEELHIRYVLWPTLDQLRALKRLKHLAGHLGLMLEIFRPPSNLKMVEVRTLGCYVAESLGRGTDEGEPISALKALGVQVRTFTVRRDQQGVPVGFLLFETFLKADDWCINKKPYEDLIPMTGYPRCASPSSALRIMNQLVQDRSPPQRPNLIFYLSYIGTIARTSEKWVHVMVSWIRRQAIGFFLFYATTFYALNFYLSWRFNAEYEVWLMAWVIFNGLFIIMMFLYIASSLSPSVYPTT